MSYLKDINNLTVSLTNLDSCLSDLESNKDLDGSWQGSAYEAQETKINDLITAIKKEKTNVSNLIDAMKSADNYDNHKKSRDDASNTINSFDSVPNWWNKGYNTYVNAIKSRDLANTNMNIEKSNCSTKLSIISSSYYVKYKVISFDDIVETKSVFDDLLNVGNEISNNLNLDTAVTTKYRKWKDSLPNWNETDAWIKYNPYAGANTGQCTWFAWGRFYEMYGYAGWSHGNGRDCARNLVNSHPDKFYLSNRPETGAVFSYKGGTYGHTGVILDVSDGMVTFQDGNMNGQSDSYKNAQTDYRTKTMTMEEFMSKFRNNIEFANPR